MKALVVTPAPVKAVEEVCVTCGSNHNFNLCPLTRGGNDFPVFQDNIQQFQQTAAVGNFLQRNQPSNLASQMRPPARFLINVQTTSFRRWLKDALVEMHSLTNGLSSFAKENYREGTSLFLVDDSLSQLELELEALTPTRMTLELANRSISHPMGIAEDVVVRVDEKEEVFCSEVPNCDNNRVNVESDFVESLINRDTSIVHSSKIDPILEEFAGELAHIAPIPPGIVEANPNDDTSSDDDDFKDIEYISLEEVNDVEQEKKEFDLEDILQIQDVILRERLLKVSRLITNIESLKYNPIPVTDSDSSDISLSYSNNSLPEFESFSDDTEETRSGSTTTHANYSLSEFESFHFDPSIPRPPPEPPDIEKCFEPEAGNLIIKEFKGVSKSHDFMTSILPTLVSDLPFISSIVSFENEDTIFDPGIVTFLRAGGIF
ncbi:hypothetical protein Tco_1404955 [Tanacetum coccineum]